MSCDEVTTINNQSWLFIHVYVTEEWKRVPILLNLQRVVNGAIFLVCFGTNGIIVSPGCEEWCHSPNYAKTCPICEWCALHGTSHKYIYLDTKCFELGAKD